MGDGWLPLYSRWVACMGEGWLTRYRRMAKFGDVFLMCKMGGWVGSFGEEFEWVNTLLSAKNTEKDKVSSTRL